MRRNCSLGAAAVWMAVRPSPRPSRRWVGGSITRYAGPSRASRHSRAIQRHQFFQSAFKEFHESPSRRTAVEHPDDLLIRNKHGWRRGVAAPLPSALHFRAAGAGLRLHAVRGTVDWKPVSNLPPPRKTRHGLLLLTLIITVIEREFDCNCAVWLIDF